MTGIAAMMAIAVVAVKQIGTETWGAGARRNRAARRVSQGYPRNTFSNPAQQAS
jgi:hypothetical protein